MTRRTIQRLARGMRGRAAALALTAAAAGPVPASALTATLWGPDLEPRPVAPASIDPSGAIRQEGVDAAPVPADAWVRIDFARTGVRPGTAGMLALIDGQRFAGAIAPDLTVADAVVWDHPRLGRLVLPLDRVAAVTPGPGLSPGPPAVVVDTLALANGETLEGFLESIEAGSARFVPRGAAAAIDVPVAGIRRVALANPAEPPPGAWTLRLADGSVLHATAVTADLSGGSADTGWRAALCLPDPGEATGPGVEATFPAAQIVAVEQRLGGHALIDLAAPEPRVTAGGAVLGWPTPPRWIDRDDPPAPPPGWLLQAPVTLTWDLPAAARGVRIDLEIDPAAGGPDRPAPRTDCTARLLGDAGPLTDAARLHAGTPSAALRAIDPGPRVSLELLPGAGGPVHDRIRLRRAWGVVAEPLPG